MELQVWSWVIPGLGFKFLISGWKGISEISIGHDGDGAIDRCRGEEGQPLGVWRGDSGSASCTLSGDVDRTWHRARQQSLCRSGQKPVHNILKVR